MKEVLSTPDEASLVRLSARPNLKTLGRRFGPRLKEITPLIQALGNEDLLRVMDGGAVTLAGEHLGADDLLIDRQVSGPLLVASGASVTVALDPEVTPELTREGLARELVNRLQNLRKDSGLEVSDRIALTLQLDGALTEAFEAHRSLILGEVLALSCERVDSRQVHDLGIEDHEATASLCKETPRP